jgi:lincosamide nucleotidyltransferase A/C/D/E
MIEIDTNYVNYHSADTAIGRYRPMMSAQDVLQILGVLRRAGVSVWLDGGWGVDALVGAQTREHDDLDCVIALGEARAAQTALATFEFVTTEDELPTRFVMRDADDRRVDFHTVTFDDKGGGVQQLQEGTSWRYPPHGFLATGRIAGQPVPCLTADVQALAHVGYEPDEKDDHDMQLLAENFGIELPESNREPR